MLKRKVKRLLSLVLVAAMASSMMSVNALAGNVEPDTQIQGYYRLDDSGKIISEAIADPTVEVDDLLTISKSIAPTGEKNVFDITLKVVADKDVQNITKPASGSVTLVLDLSGSMKEKISAGDADTKLESLRKATVNFINSYADTSTGGARWLSVVLYSSAMERVNFKPAAQSGGNRYWIDVSTPANRADAIKFLNEYFQYWGSFGETNIAQGLNQALSDQGAAEVKDVDSHTVVLMSDGAPNQGGDVLGERSAAAAAANVAEKIRALPNTTFYSLYFGNPMDLCYYYTTESGQVLVYTGEWMESIASDGCYKNATTGETLDLIFQDISNNVVTQTSGWIIRDPMGAIAEWIDYEKLDLAARGVTRNADGSLTWDLSKDTKTSTDESPVTFEFTYRIKLKYNDQNFKEGEVYPTNGKTTLTYYTTVTDESDGSVTNKENTADFLVPGVTIFRPQVPYTIEYYKLDRNGGGKDSPADTKEGTGKLFDTVSLADIDGRYATKYQSSPDFLYLADDTTTTLTLASETANVLKVYYAPRPTKVNVEYYYKTDVTNADGTTTPGEYPDAPQEQQTVTDGLYIGDSFDTPIINPYQGVDYTVDAAKSTSPLNGIKLKETNGVIQVYLYGTRDDRLPAQMEVFHVYTYNTWELNKDGRYESVEHTGEPISQLKINDLLSSQEQKLITDSVTLDDVKEYTFTRAEVPSGKSGKVVETEAGHFLKVAPGEDNVVYLYFENVTKKDDVLTPADVTVTYSFTKDVMYLDENKLPQHDKTAPETYSDSVDGYYVGERFDAKEYAEKNATQTEADGLAESAQHLYKIVTSDENLVIKSLGRSQNTVSVAYSRVSTLETADATVNHIYQAWETVTIVHPEEKDEATGEVTKEAWEETVTRIKEDGTQEKLVEVPGLSVGQLYSPDLNPLGLEGYAIDKDASTPNYNAYPIVKEGNNLTIVYNTLPEDNRNTATITVKHEYITYLSTVENNVVVIKPITVYGPPDVIDTYRAGDPFTPESRPELDGVDYALKGELPTVTLRTGENPSITLTYTREDSDLKEATLNVTHTYKSRTMEIVDGKAVYSDDETTWTTDGTSSDYTVVDGKPDPMYANMVLEIEAATLFQSQDYKLLSETNVINLAEGKNTLELVYLRDIPLEKATVKVIHHYTDTVISSTGEPTDTPSTVPMPDDTSHYNGETVTVEARPDGRTFDRVTVSGELPFDQDSTTKAVTISPTGEVTVDFYYTSLTDHSVGNEATYEIRHYYRTMDWYDKEGEVEYELGKNGSSGQSYGTLTVSCLPDLLPDDQGKSTYELDKVDAPEGYDEDKGTLTLVPGENVVEFYYTNHIDTRVASTVTVVHRYQLLDAFTNEVVSTEYEWRQTVSKIDDGAYVNNLFWVTDRSNTGILSSDFNYPTPKVEVGEDVTLPTYVYASVDPAAGNIRVSETAKENQLTITYTRVSDQTTYTVKHAYYYDGTLRHTTDGSTVVGKIGSTITSSQVEQIPVYQGVTYTFAGTEPTGGVLLVADPSANVLTMVYRYTPPTTPPSPETPAPTPPGGDEREPKPTPTPPTDTTPPVAPPAVEDGTDIPDQGVPLDPGLDIDEPDTPLAALPDDPGDNMIIVDEATPLGNLPQTGTQRGAGPMMMGLSATLAAAGVLLGIGRKQKKED